MELLTLLLKENNKLLMCQIERAIDQQPQVRCPCLQELLLFTDFEID